MLSEKTSRRQALKGFGLGVLGLTSVGMLEQNAVAAALPGVNSTDASILNFALNLEYLEAEFYSFATTGQSIQAQGVAAGGRGTPGGVTIKANPQVPFATPAIRQYAEEITRDEIAHVKFLRSVLGNRAVARPQLDLQGSFTAAAIAAGVIEPGQTFDPFADELSFLLAAFIFEDVGVTAYRGAAPLITNKTVLSAAAGILGAEAYHASNIRTNIYSFGADAQAAAQKISNLRDSLDGATDRDQGVVLSGSANIVPTDANGLTYARTVRQVLNIVYFGVNVHQGGFFPNGINYL